MDPKNITFINNDVFFENLLNLIILVDSPYFILRIDKNHL